MISNPVNHFRRRLAQGDTQIGLWLSMPDPYSSEVCAGAGFDWLLIDGEHAPNDVRSILAQLQAIAAYSNGTNNAVCAENESPSHPIVRLVSDDKHLIKQILDIGAQTVLIPMVESGAQAAAIVAATRYPPEGTRGVGSALARASRWNRVQSYLQVASSEICVLVQVESRVGIDNLEEIAATPGIDGVFLGPSDLAASFGHLGDSAHPDMIAILEKAISTILDAGKSVGILAFDEKLARHWISLGCSFVAVAADVVILAKETARIAQSYKT